MSVHKKYPIRCVECSQRTVQPTIIGQLPVVRCETCGEVYFTAESDAAISNGERPPMKTYIVYDSQGNEVGYYRGGSHNAAEAAAKKKFGERASVSYTELGKEFDHIKSGTFFTDSDAKK